MTEEFILKIRAAQTSLKQMQEEKDNEIKSWRQKNLDPLIRDCTHRYPWGDYASNGDYLCRSCSICGSYLGRS